MPVATGGGSKPKPPKPPKKPKPTTTLPATDTSVGGNTNAGKKPKPTTTLPATDTSVGGNTGISQAAKEARQQRRSEAKHRERRLNAATETRAAPRQQQRAGNNRVTRAIARGANTPSETRSLSSQKRIGKAINAPGKDPYTGGGGTRSQVTGDTRTGTRKTRSGGDIGGSTFGSRTDKTRFSGGGVKHISPERTRVGEGVSRPPTNVGGGTRVGGGFGKGDLGRPAPAFFDGGSAGGGGGTAGANPLSAGVTNADVRKLDMEDVLHGGKRKGRVRHTRGTE